MSSVRFRQRSPGGPPRPSEPVTRSSAIAAVSGDTTDHQNEAQLTARPRGRIPDGLKTSSPGSNRQLGHHSKSPGEPRPVERPNRAEIPA